MRRRAQAAILEALALAVVALGVAFTINWASDTGMALGKNHFRNAVPHAPSPTEPTSTSPEPETPADTSAAEPLDDPGKPPNPMDAETLAREGFQVIAHEDVVAMVQGDAYLADLDILVDARDDTHYEEGHIAGAYQLDHYRAERYLDELLPVCMSAARIVVYCNGGKCDDSKLAAGTLMESGIDPNKIFIYVGGATAWNRDGLPMESGARLSGEIVYLPAEEE